MGRPPRILTHSTLVHVWNRGADRHDLFVDERDKTRFVDLLASHTGAHGVSVHAYALMDNHVHLLLESPDGLAEPLSNAMHAIATPWAREHNRTHRRTGPLFENRFGMREITSDAQLDRVGRYIHRNPLALALDVPLARYPFSSLPVYAGLAPPPDWLTTGRVRGSFAGSPADYVAFVERRLPSDDVSGGWPWGTPEVDDLIAAVASVIGCCDDSVRSGAAGHERARLLAITLAVEFRLVHGEQLARVFGYEAPSSARSAARRGRIRFGSDPSFASARAAVLRRIGRLDAA